MKSKWGYVYWLKGEIRFIVKMAKVSMKSGLFSRAVGARQQLGYIGVLGSNNNLVTLQRK
jgi:hypothetical protein